MMNKNISDAQQGSDFFGDSGGLFLFFSTNDRASRAKGKRKQTTHST